MWSIGVGEDVLLWANRYRYQIKDASLTWLNNHVSSNKLHDWLLWSFWIAYVIKLSSSLLYSLSASKSSWSPLGNEGIRIAPLFSGGKEGKEGRGSPLGQEGSEGSGTPLGWDSSEGRGDTSSLAWDGSEGRGIAGKRNRDILRWKSSESDKAKWIIVLNEHIFYQYSYHLSNSKYWAIYFYVETHCFP